MGQHNVVHSGSVAVLLGLALVCPALGETPEEEFAKLEKAFKEQSKESLEKVLKLESREERAAVFKERRAAREKFASDAWEFASKHVGKEVTVDALHAVLTNSSRASKPDEESLRSKALATLRRDHLKSPNLGRLVMMFGASDDETEQAFIREVLDKNPHQQIQGLILYLKARDLLQRARYATRYKASPELQERMAKSEAGKKYLEKILAFDVARGEKEATELFQRIRKEYPEVQEFRSREDDKRKPRTLGQLADQYLFALANLKVGSKAPDLESVDLDGKQVRLSDYRGSIVVLDVWATWCGPCVAMIPHQTELVSRLKDRPFALVSVSIDEEVETLTKFLVKKPMPWVHWFNGYEGGVVDTLNIGAIPTIYVIDANGIIRAKDVRGEELDKAVDALLEEMATKTDSAGGLTRREKQ